MYSTQLLAAIYEFISGLSSTLSQGTNIYMYSSIIIYDSENYRQNTGGAVGSGTALQARRSQVQFPTGTPYPGDLNHC
jgi:hypothetical protein